jgi:hypothetical protein
MKRIILSTLFVAGLAVVTAGPVYAIAIAVPDTVTVATATTTSTVVDVPVYIRDASGTPLGIDQPSGSRIQSYSIKVTYAPTAPVQSITFTRAGITAPLTPVFESSPSSPGSVSLLDTFNEGTNLIPFTSNAAIPGNLIGHLTVNLVPGTAPGTIITLTLDPTLTQVTDAGGVTIESTTNGQLTLVNGSITVLAQVPALSTWALSLLAISLALAAMRLRA